MTNVTERQCAACGRTFTGYKAKCEACRATKRQCVTCGATFTGRNRECASCRIPRRTCTACDRVYRGTQLLCPACRLTDRECLICGTRFRGLYRKCSACRTTSHACVTCGFIFQATNSQCQACRQSSRACITCGNTHRRLTLECDGCSGRSRAASNARRARKHAAQVTGPVPHSVYAEVLATGPCVYCGEAATDVDHIRPLARGGDEARHNLVPACQRCNQSKGHKLLTGWDRAKVEFAAARHPAIAAELDRELADYGHPEE
jgi:HNH endonuclease